MGLQAFDHYSLRTADLDAAVRFYTGVLGLVIGPRPPFNFPGFWLYGGQHESAIIHLIGDESLAPDPKRGHDREGGARAGGLDHIAFRATGLDDMQSRLERAGLPFRVARVPGRNLQQVFVEDPMGVMIELTFTEDPSSING